MAFDSLASRYAGPMFDTTKFDFNDPFDVLESLKTPGCAEVVGVDSLTHYLKQSPLSSFLNLDRGGNLFFHWANWSHTCQLQREHHAEHPERLRELESVLSSLKRIEIWLKGPRGTIKTCLYDLYEHYLDPRLRSSLFLKSQDREREVLFSDYGEAGPFKCLSGMRWFDKNIYALFVFRKLLLGFVPQRQFRLSTNLVARWWPNGSPLDEIEVKIHQVSSSGVLFRVKSSCELARLIHQCQGTTTIHFPRALLNAPENVDELEGQLEDRATIKILLTCADFEQCGAWDNAKDGDGTFFFVDAKTLFGQNQGEFTKTVKRYEELFKSVLR